MIKAGGPNVVLLGLSERNVELLKLGKPIQFDGKEIGIPGKKVFIMYGETEEDILDELRRAGIMQL